MVRVVEWAEGSGWILARCLAVIGCAAGILSGSVVVLGWGGYRAVAWLLG